MVEPQKFLFNVDYSTNPENIKKREEAKIISARDLLSDEFEQSKQQSFQQGFEQGEKQALERLKQELNAHIDNISMNISQLEKYKQDLHAIFEQEALLTVRHLVKYMYFKSEKLFPDILLQQSINNAMKNMPFSTKVLIKVPHESKQYINDTQIEEKLKNKGISDFLIIEDPTLSTGESLIEWDQSGILSSKQESINNINKAISAFLSQEDNTLSDESISNNKINSEIKQLDETPQNLEPQEASLVKNNSEKID